MKCLEKDRTRRYSEASSLARDIEHHLHNEPVIARPPTGFYRFQKFLRRNKLLLSAGAAMFVSLVTVVGAVKYYRVKVIEAD